MGMLPYNVTYELHTISCMYYLLYTYYYYYYLLLLLLLICSMYLLFDITVYNTVC